MFHDRLTISLTPFEIKSLKTQVWTKLNSILLVWNDKLFGIPLSYSNVKILSNGRIHEETPLLHYTVQFKVVYLKFPKIGSTIQGTITAINDSHISCMIMDLVWAEIPLSSINSPNMKVLWSSDSESNFTEIINEKGWKFQEGDSIGFVFEDMQG